MKNTENGIYHLTFVSPEMADLDWAFDRILEIVHTRNVHFPSNHIELRGNCFASTLLDVDRRPLRASPALTPPLPTTDVVIYGHIDVGVHLELSFRCLTCSGLFSSCFSVVVLQNEIFSREYSYLGYHYRCQNERAGPSRRHVLRGLIRAQPKWIETIKSNKNEGRKSFSCRLRSIWPLKAASFRVVDSRWVLSQTAKLETAGYHSIS